MPGLIQLPHRVEYHLITLKIKVGIHLYPALIGMTGHGVPVAARFQRRHALGELAGFQSTGMDKLVDGDALVALFQSAQRSLGRLLNINQPGFISTVGRRTDHVELAVTLGSSLVKETSLVPYMMYRQPLTPRWNVSPPAVIVPEPSTMLSIPISLHSRKYLVPKFPQPSSPLSTGTIS